MNIQETCDAIRLNYRLAKNAEQTRIRIDQGLVSFARVFLTGWTPGATPAERKKAADLARKSVMSMMEDGVFDGALSNNMAELVAAVLPARNHIEDIRKKHRKEAEKLVESLPAWDRVKDIRGLSSWGLAVLIGEAGDIGNYSGCRKLYKRYGLAPDECYPTGQKKKGRMIPRMSRGRVMGCIADALLRSQWRGEKDDVAAHAIGPYGEVYGGKKKLALEAGKKKGHADRLARRAMVKALIHDVWSAWHEQPMQMAV